MATATTTARPPFPPFTADSAMQKVRLAEDAWNSRDPAKVALAYARARFKKCASLKMVGTLATPGK